MSGGQTVHIRGTPNEKQAQFFAYERATRLTAVRGVVASPGHCGASWWGCVCAIPVFAVFWCGGRWSS